MNVSFNGIGELSVTFMAEEGTKASMPVKLTENGTVGDALNGDRFCGVCLYADDGCATVQTRGYVKLPYTGTAPALGYAKLVSDGNGGVKTAETGGEVLVAEVDTAESTVGFFM